jgi:hypothetical protein
MLIVETYYPIFDLGWKNQEISTVFPLDSNKQRLPPVLSLARKQLAGVKMRVIYLHVIKKDDGYIHAIKNFVGTCMPRPQLSLTHVPFRPPSVGI